MSKSRRKNPQVHTGLTDLSPGVSPGGGGAVGFLSTQFRVPRPPFRVIRFPYEPEGDLVFLFNEGAHSGNWVEGFGGGSNTQSKGPRTLNMCTGPSSVQNEATWESIEPYDFSEVDEIWVLWENTGTDSFDNYSLMTVGPQGASALEGELIFFQEGPLEKQYVVIDVSDYNGTGYLKVHSMSTGSQVESCVEVSVVALVKFLGLANLPSVDVCSNFDLPEGEELVWMIYADVLDEGVNRPVHPICSEEQFILRIVRNDFIRPVWLANDRPQGQHSVFLGGWGNSAIIAKHNNWVHPITVAEEVQEGEDSLIPWGDSEILVTDNSHLAD